ncbi:PREDICTED: cysteine-rich receptor-like protein kinase 26 [Camelina sativa]|uniref:Cysteine-rich receptor-like protein kinase 26 n=1 Tax=Camelina sativa TaxID=90675 RepID=A0ABM0TUW4_CAMSA|nr:PREDICTED: cysteine-rich receptor-like protein kinase 26 [Camelina sativa]
MLSLLVPLISLLIQIQCLTVVKSQPVPLKLNQICSNVTGNFTVNTPYAVNLDRLISSLSSLRHNDNGFYNISVGDSDGKVNSISQCRGDVKPEDCINCIAVAGKRLVTLCPVQKEAIIWYDKCTVRYSNRTIYERLEIYPQASITGTRNFTGDRGGWEKSLRGLLEGLKDRASVIGRSKKNFVVGETSGPSFQTLYGLVQCTPDVSEEDCSYCLSQGIAKIPNCCDMKMGSYVLSPSCILAYATWRFYYPVNIDEPSSVPATPSRPPKNETKSVTQGDKNRGVPKALIFAAASVAVVVFVIVFLLGFLRLRRKMKNSEHQQEKENISMDSMKFSFSLLQEATSHFSLENKLGEGGFGAVYKGVLSDGQKIAVKRLSRNAQQGETEFKNEFLLVAKLQHRNLVKLLGYSIEGTERLLVYEFLPHTSLDKFIFDPIEGKELEWEVRYKIIGGVARGLLYLHQDSRLRIIHRDLKASNILLDEEMTPKIADFGMARLFDIDHTTQRYTNRIVGTFGYMAPEYVMHGQFSFKTDVYSFGVLVLEIISGKKNSCFSNENSMEDLLSFAWRNWKEGVALNLVDKIMMTMSSYSSNMILRCINIGLLCVQEKVAERPSMASVLLMLDGHTLAISEPSKPAFFAHSNTVSDSSSSSGHNAKTSNYNSNTELYPR